MLRRMRRVGGLLCAWGLAGCVVEVEPEQLAALCEVREPTQVVTVDATRVLAEAPLQVGGQVLYSLRAPLAREEQLTTLKYGPPELLRVGACGESPVALGGLESPTLRERWPGLALACDPSTRQIVAIDLRGGLKGEPRPMYSDCGVAWSGHGRVSVAARGEVGDTLFLLPDPASVDGGPAAPELLYGPVSTRQQEPRAVQVLEDRVFASTPDDRVVSIDLRTREVKVEQAGVRHFHVSADGRYLLWQGLEVLSGPEASEIRGPVVLNDRERDVGIGLGAAGLGYNSNALQWAAQGLMVVTVGTYQQIYRLPELTAVDVPEGLVVDPLGPLDDHRWLVRGPWTLYTHVIDFTTGVTTPLFLESATLIGRDREAAWMVEMLPCCDLGSYDAEGPVWRVPIDGSPPWQVAGRASRYAVKSGDQLLTVVDVDRDYVGALLRVDLTTGAEAVVDDRVFATSLQVDAAGVVRYSRVEADGGASVWQFALPG